jgi:hypothetical protein
MAYCDFPPSVQRYVKYVMTCCLEDAGIGSLNNEFIRTMYYVRLLLPPRVSPRGGRLGLDFDLIVLAGNCPLLKISP